MSSTIRYIALHAARLTRLTALLALVGAAIAAPAGLTRAQDDEPIKVVATFSILADWVENVGHGDIELTTIVPASGDAHTFDPNPEQLASIADADLIFEIGLNFESWLDGMYEASGSSAERVVVSDHMALLSSDGNGHEDDADGHEVEGDDNGHEDEGDDHAGEDRGHEVEADDHVDEDDGHEHEPGAFDPHVWGDVHNAISAVEVISQHLSEVDADNAATYEANAGAYTTQLEDLHSYIETETQTIPEDRRKLVTTHDTFGYFAGAYDFEIIGTALSSVSTEGGDPPASEIAELVEAIENEGVPAIFAENVSNNDLMQAIADEAGVILADPLYTDALGEPGSDGDSYIAMMTWNTDTIVAALIGE